MAIDFSSLNKLVSPSSVSEEASEASKKAPGDVLQKRIDNNTQMRQKALEAHQGYLKSIQTVGSLTNEISKGLNQGEDLTQLFFKACLAISKATDNPLFYEDAQKKIKAVYGIGLGYETPLKLKIEETQERLKKLEEALLLATGREATRIKHAITEHKKQLDMLSSRL